MSTPAITILDHRAMAMLLGLLLLVMAPHFLQIPWWESGVVVMLAAWRWYAARRGWRLPGRLLRSMIIVLALVAIITHFGTFTGLDASVSLLVAMLMLKLIELRQRRDLLVLLFIAYFVQATHFLYSQEMALAAYVFFTTWLLVTLHIHLSHRQPQPLKASLRTAALLLGQAIPLMVALFVLFPRLPGPVWGLPHDAGSGKTGLDDSMSPGNISNLSQSDAIAFRVSFEGAVPPPQQRYWRGPVLTLTDGRNWVPLRSGGFANYTTEWRGKPLVYSVTLEPHNRKWLFALDLPASSTAFGHINSDHQIIADDDIHQRLLYRAVSYPNYVTTNLSTALRRATLQLPDDINPKTVALGESLRRDYRDDNAIIQQALALYRNEEFTYTLRPPLLQGDDPTDQFLFETRRGFCEHFASSFVMIMRAAAIPARVVTGYQGGELNEVGNYLIVRQRDAHAWTEVWLEGRGWTRVDPTAAVAPERIERGIDVSASDENGVLFTPLEGTRMGALLQQLRHNLDAINNGWNQWVLGYTAQQQSNFLQRFGLNIKSWRQVGITLAVVITMLLGIAALSLLIKRQPNRDPVQQQYQQFCDKLARRGLLRQPQESATEFAQRIAANRPELASEAARITALYSQLRYAPDGNTQQLQQLKEAVTAFRA